MKNKNDKFWVESNVSKLRRDLPTNFLNPKETQELKNVLNKMNINYHVFSIFDECDNKIFYVDNCPSVTCFEIVSNNKLTHQSIMGSIFSLNIDKSIFGDIVIDDDKYYITVLDYMADYFKENLNMIGSLPVTLKEVPIHVISNFKRKYEDINLIVPSLRIDSIISKIIHTSRSKAISVISNKEIVVNYQELNNSNYKLKEGDIFSIRKFGKYKFIEIVKNTKKDNLIIHIKKYIN